MKSARIKFLLCLTALISFSCSSHKPVWTSDQQRAESFQSYGTTKVNGQPINLFLERRTAVLVSGINISAAGTNGQTLAIEFKLEPNRSVSVGHATAIEVDGYFLTAAHLMNQTINYIIYLDGQTARLAIPRIVAKQGDVAIIHVDTKLADFFTWAGSGEIRAGNPVVTVGFCETKFISANRGSKNEICLGGQIKAVKQSAYGAKMIFSDLPTREGDSGSPLSNMNGELLGVHSGTTASSTDIVTAVAICPSQSWITNIIAQDRLRSSTEPQIKIPMIEKDKDAPGIVISLY